MWYRVGSRNERPGITGASHWVEHMLFKGGREFGKGDIFKQVARHGGTNNGFTSNDFTAYFETLPADALDLGLRIEADRMAHALFDPAEFESERTVILSEREGAENSPVYLLAEEIDATAFREHPYRWSVLGSRRDLESMTRDNLYGHYRTFYAPNNAVLVVAGHFDRPTLLDRVAELYGDVPRVDDIPVVDVVEPPQLGERRVTLRRRGGAALVYVGHRVPSSTDADVPALRVAATLLGGASAMGMGSGLGSRTSRLHVRLVRGDLASRAYTAYRPAKNPALFSVGATVRQGVSPDRVEAALVEELDRLASEPASNEEMDRARTQLRAVMAYSWDGVTAIGGLTGHIEMLEGYEALETYLDRLEAVTRDQVCDVITRYFTPESRVVGTYVPQTT
jgi:zinc protease